MKLKFFFLQFPNPWALRVSGMGGYTSKCEKKSKSLHPRGACTVHRTYIILLWVSIVDVSSRRIEACL
jgi:hypothetical protein